MPAEVTQVITALQRLRDLAVPVLGPVFHVPIMRAMTSAQKAKIEELAPVMAEASRSGIVITIENNQLQIDYEYLGRLNNWLKHHGISSRVVDPDEL